MSETQPFAAVLAKSVLGQGEPVTVADHCVEVAESAAAIVEAVGPSLAEFFGLAAEDEARLGLLLAVAALIHDLGKAGSSFQAQMQQYSRQRHPFRHEWLSGAACMTPVGLGAWINRALPDARERVAVLAAVMGHHVRTRSSAPVAREPRDEVMWLEHPSLSVLWGELAIHAGAEAIPEPVKLSLSKVEWEDLLFQYFLFVQNTVRSEPQSARSLVSLVACCKAVLIAADTVASARLRKRSAAQWAKSALQKGLEEDELDKIVSVRLGDHSPHMFQEMVASSRKRVTLVEAGCGSGKTLAAYMWARHHADGKRLVFCYPTTGTTSAGFEDYLLAQSDLERALMHSRASADIEHILDNGSLDDGDDGLWIADVLDLWGTKVVACTVDAVLSLLACWRRALAASPVFAQSAFVFDEVHSYDEHLFGAFLAFLRWTPASCLVMTASLSNARRDAIERACGQPLEPIRGEPETENAVRYRVELVERNVVPGRVDGARKQGGKVLYVANTVSRATEAFDMLQADWGPHARLYHSRFRYEDRVRIQAEVIELFRSPGPAFVAATQVCEMSLDISASLLISELAPFPSIVQRLGRLNRRPYLPETPCAALMVEPPSPLPYREAELSLARDTLVSLDGRKTSQRDLAQALAAMDDGPYEDRRMPLLSADDLAGTYPGMLREGSVSFPLVREEDLRGSWDRIKRSELIRLTIPMPPKGHNTQGWPRLRGMIVAPEGNVRYDPQRGAQWRN